MAIDTNGELWVFCLNVGQGDTTVILTPGNKVIIVDAMKPDKTTRLLEDLGLADGDPLHHIVVSHPHSDHYSAVVRLLNTYAVGGLTLASLRRVTNTTAGYNDILNTAIQKSVPLSFLSGYTQLFPDGNPVDAPDTPKLELLGPSNQFIEDLHQARALNTNHYSIIARLIWKQFRMVIAADAQMETWAHFDSEQMMEEACSVLRTAHHGSANGTQYERIDRLAPRAIIVSSELAGADKLPDLIGCAVYLRYAEKSFDPLIALTDDVGTVKIAVDPAGNRTFFAYGDSKNQNVDLTAPQPLTAANDSDWEAHTRSRMNP
jgi:competence protein ComEC